MTALTLAQVAASHFDITAETSGQMQSSLEQMIQEAVREYEMRRKHYPRFVEQGKLSQIAASQQLMLQQDIVKTLRWLQST